MQSPPGFVMTARVVAVWCTTPRFARLSGAQAAEEPERPKRPQPTPNGVSRRHLARTTRLAGIHAPQPKRLTGNLPLDRFSPTTKVSVRADVASLGGPPAEGPPVPDLTAVDGLPMRSG